MAQSLGKNDDYGLNNRYMAEFKKEIKSKTRASDGEDGDIRHDGLLAARC